MNTNAKKWVRANTFRHKVILFRRATKIKDPQLTLENVKNKFGDNPCCYLTGTPINLDKSDSYELDHIVPVSRGGDSSLKNCGLASKDANQAKRNQTPDEFIALCAAVAAHCSETDSPQG